MQEQNTQTLETPSFVKPTGQKIIKRKVYDNIHGFIYFDQIIWDFVDTPHFQRLRKIKQTGCLEYVFPGATHSRFEHCLGTAYLAKKFMETLIDNHPKLYNQQEKNSAILTVTLAGLLHDIGHGPYSHMFDSYIVTSINKNGVSTKWTHEIASEALFQHMTQLQQLKGKLTPQQIERVKLLIRGTKEGPRKWQFELISNKENGIDVDKLDYFRRDAFYLGAKNIYVDHDLLMNQARIIGNEICYPTKYVETVYNIFHSRYKLYKSYYGNIVSIGIEKMICDILELTKEKFELKKACEEIFEDPRKYLRLNDSIIEKVEDKLEQIRYKTPEDKESIENFEKALILIERIKKRKIYKFVKEITCHFIEGQVQCQANQLQKKMNKQHILQYITAKTKISPSEFCITVNQIGFGLKKQNPLRKVGFFRKQQQELQKLPACDFESLSLLYTHKYVEWSVKVFIKEDNLENFKRVGQALQSFKMQSSSTLKLGFGSVGKTPKQPETLENKQIIKASEPLFF